MLVAPPKPTVLTSWVCDATSNFEFQDRFLQSRPKLKTNYSNVTDPFGYCELPAGCCSQHACIPKTCMNISVIFLVFSLFTMNVFELKLY